MTRLAALLVRPPADPRPDGALLAAFLTDRDEPAFAELVRRHGRLVWGTCRRLLPDPADAEDAFQATFLVLVRRAGRLTRAATVGPWLYRVASLTARNLRRKNARRLARTEPLSAGLNPAARPEPAPVGVDDVLAGLSERERAAIVLCLLDGLTQREAADRLGLPEGTVSARVSRGLAKLRDKLGAEPAAVVVIGSLVPAATAEAAVRAAVAYQLAATATPAVASLVDGVLRMFWLKKATAVGLAACVLLGTGTGIGLAIRQAPATAGDPPSGTATTSVTESQSERDATKIKNLERLAQLTETNLGKKQQVLDSLQRDLDATKGEVRELMQSLARIRDAIDSLKKPGEAANPGEANRQTDHWWHLQVNSQRASGPFQLTERRGHENISSTLFLTAGSLKRFLARARKVEGWPTNLSLTVESARVKSADSAQLDLAFLTEAAEACRDAGFDRVRLDVMLGVDLTTGQIVCSPATRLKTDDGFRPIADVLRTIERTLSEQRKVRKQGP